MRPTVTPDGMLISLIPRARSGMVLTPMPPSMRLVLSVIRCKVWVSLSPDSVSDTGCACAMVRSTAAGSDGARATSARTAPSASTSLNFREKSAWISV